MRAPLGVPWSGFRVSSQRSSVLGVTNFEELGFYFGNASTLGA